MPDDRFIHPALGHSEKVCGLNDLEARVWGMGYLLAADDCGVMRLSAITVQNVNEALATRPVKLIEKCLQRLIDVGLLLTFDHQGRRFIFQHDWQDWQRVRHPRETVNPQPPPEQIGKCSEAQQELFRLASEMELERSRKAAEKLRGDSPRAGTRERLTATAEAKAPATGNGAADAPVVREQDPARRSAGQPPLTLGLRRIKVWRWMLDDLIAALGEHADAFDIMAWLQVLDAKETRGIPDVWPWLKNEMLAEARRRNVPMVETSDRKPMFSQTSKEMGEAVLANLKRETGLPR